MNLIFNILIRKTLIVINVVLCKYSSVNNIRANPGETIQIKQLSAIKRAPYAIKFVDAMKKLASVVFV